MIQNKIILIFLFFFSSPFLYSQNQEIHKEILIDNIVLKGNYSFTREELLKVLNLKEKSKYPNAVIKQSVEKLEFFYQQSGYSICVVNGTLDLDNNLIIEIREGIIREILFLNLSYIEVYLFRQDFGTYKDKVFYKPLIEEKLKSVKMFQKYTHYEYSFAPVEDRPGYFYLYIAPGKKPANLKKNEREPKMEIFSSFRGWALSLVPYFWVDFYNMGGIDHNLRVRVDWRFSTIKWGDLDFKESIENQDYSANYFTPPFYKDLRVNIFAAINIAYHNTAYAFTGTGFDRTNYPLESGVGFDLGYFWASLRTGFLFERIHRIEYFSPYDDVKAQFPEMAAPEVRRYQVFSLNLEHVEQKKFVKEREDSISFEMKYLFNQQYSWMRSEFNIQKYIFDKDNIFVFRYRAFYMYGNYPIFTLKEFSDEFHLRGYGGLDKNMKYLGFLTDKGMDGTVESWVSLYSDTWYQIFFLDAGVFDDRYFDVPISTGKVALTYGIGLALNLYEIHCRILYALPIEQRADKGTISWFLRRRF